MNKKLILIVDDIEGNRRLLIEYVKLLTDFGCIQADNGYKCIKLAVKENPDLILLDFMMPGINGLETLIRLKKLKKTKEIPVIIVSAYSDSEVIAKCLEAGASEYFHKPSSFELLLEKIKSLT